MAAAFDEAARVRLCESSGSEHSPELSDLVNSFIERDNGWDGGDILDHDEEIDKDIERINDEGSENGCDWSEASEKKDVQLKSLLMGNHDGDDHDDHMIKQKIRDEAVGMIGLGDVRSDQGFKRRLMAHLRAKGFDAGKSLFFFFFYLLIFS